MTLNYGCHEPVLAVADKGPAAARAVEGASEDRRAYYLDLISSFFDLLGKRLDVVVEGGFEAHLSSENCYCFLLLLEKVDKSRFVGLVWVIRSFRTFLS